MTNEFKQIINTEIKKLPQIAQDIINKFEWEKISEEIGGKYLLNENDINILQQEIGLVLIEKNNKDLLSINIEDNVKTSKIESLKIVQDINQEIFKPMLVQMESSIKSNVKFLKPSWDQKVDFIISGGDYSVFVKRSEEADTIPKPYGPNISKLRI